MGKGNDTYIVDDAGDVIVELPGGGIDSVRSSISYILGANLENLILTGAGNINGTGNAQNNIIIGNTGDNILEGGAGADTLSGGLGNDTYIVNLLALGTKAVRLEDTIIESKTGGVDTLMLVSGTLAVSSAAKVVLSSYIENLDASGTGATPLTLQGNASANTIIGNSGNNILDGLGGIDTLIGGDGDDVYILDRPDDIVVEDVGEGNDTVRIAYNNIYALAIIVDISSFQNIENITISGTGKFDVVGDENDNTLIGNAYVNILTGNGGNDTLNGGRGADTMIGGSGNDIYYVDNIGDRVIENVNDGIDTVYASISYVLGSNIEKGFLLGSSSLRLTGNAGNNELTGNAGSNILDGGLGADRMAGGKGNDTYIVDNAGDVVVELSREGTDTVRSSIGYVLGDNVENLVLTGTGNINGTGNAQNNIITGNSGTNVLEGGAGIDKLYGGLGNDTYIVNLLALGTKAVRLEDTIVESKTGGVDTLMLVSGTLAVSSAAKVVLSSYIENLDASGTGATPLTLQGNASANTIIGNSGDNKLYGLNGDDVLYGRGGNDFIDGGTGIDTARFSGNLRDYTITKTGTYSYTITGNDGHDTLNNIERLQFIGDNRTYTVAEAQDILASGNADALYAQNMLAQANRSEGLSNPSLALGVSGVTDYGSQMPYLDMMKFARQFWAVTNGDVFSNDPDVNISTSELKAGGYLDADGWPITVPDGGIYTGWFGDSFAERAGTYVVRYEGEGTILFSQDANIVSQTQGEIVYTTTGGPIMMTISETDPNHTGDYLKNITVVKEEYVDLFDAGALFNPDFLDFVKDVRELRFMDWMETNASQVSSASEIVFNPDAAGPANAKPISDMIRLANEAGTDIWVNMPAHATDEYVRQFAMYVRDHLDPGLKVTVEYSNETWNWNFEQTHYLLDLAESEWGPGADWIQYQTMKAANVAMIWDDVFDAQADDRVINVLGTQTGYFGLTQRQLEAPQWYAHDPDAPAISDIFDALAVNTYFGSGIMAEDALRTELLSVLSNPNIDAAAWLHGKLIDPQVSSSIPVLIDYLFNVQDLADSYGLDLKSYEGGQHVHHLFGLNIPQSDMLALQDFMTDFVRSPEMADLYKQLWEGWQSLNPEGGFMQFGSVEQSGIWGSWALLSTYSDTNPRYEYLIEKNQETPAWWSTGGGQYQQGVTTSGTNQADVLIGTRQEDYLLGGAGDDVIIGGLGNDGINGGDGTDTLILSGQASDYFMYAIGNGFILRGRDGFDHIVSVERFTFSDGTSYTLQQLTNTNANNTGPVALDDHVQAVEETPITLSGLTANDTDADNDRLSVIEVGKATHGKVVLNTDGTVTYTPYKDFFGNDSFSYTVSDGMASSQANVNIVVNNVNDAPVILTGHPVQLFDETPQGTVFATIGFTDADGDQNISYSIVSGNNEGLFGINSSTGELYVANGAALKTNNATEIHNLMVRVSDQSASSQSVVSIELYGDDTFIPNVGHGNIYNGGLGFDVVDLSGYASSVYIDGALQASRPVLGLRDSDSIFSISLSGAQATVNGIAVTADYWVLNENALQHNGPKISNNPVDTVLALANIAINVEEIIGTQFGDYIQNRGSKAIRLLGNDGDDYLFGGDSNDYIDGGTGNDNLYGGDGIDTILGGLGSDRLTGNEGADIFLYRNGDIDNSGIMFDEILDFNISEGDAIDLHALIAGNFHAGVSDITNFVQIVDDGVNSSLFVDQTGSGSQFVKVADILNVTGLTDEQALVNSGNIII